MKAYLDNVADSGRVLGDLQPAAEMDALRELEEADRTGVIELVTSRESWREQEKTKDPAKRVRLEAARGLVPVVRTDHVVLGHHSQMRMLGTTAVGPLVTDVVDHRLFAELTNLGLKAADARHLMYAYTNGCSRFVTLDPDFLDRRSALEAHCRFLRIVTPCQLAAELSTRREDPTHA